MEAIANPTHIPRLVTIRTLVKLAQGLDGEQRDAVLAATKSYLRDCIHRGRYKASRKARGLAVRGEPPPEAPEPLVKDGIRQVCNNCRFLVPNGYGPGENEGLCKHGGTRTTETDKHFCNLFEPSIAALASRIPPPGRADEGEEDADDKEKACCRDCVHFEHAVDWCTKHRMNISPKGHKCMDFRARWSVKCGDCAKYSPLDGCSSGMETAGAGLSAACGEFELKEEKS